jgi:hypothetical protein
LRLWSIHPEYLDAKGLVALWREALLAQKVLQGKTKGYRNHPQLIRFDNSADPLAAIAAYLRYVAAEADKRGYAFDKSKIQNKRRPPRLAVTEGQVKYEFEHLLDKLQQRDPAQYKRLKQTSAIKTHPLFKQRKGGVADWERVGKQAG